MAWTPLSKRINSLPLLLAGPILRHTDLSSVTVWVVLKESRTVTLSVYSGASSSRASVLGGFRQTVQIGRYLHVVAVTASGGTLKAGTIYYYDLDFGNSQTLQSPGIVNTNLAYGTDDLPSFALPPIELGKLRLIHGSCRQPHAMGRDMLPAIDLMIKEARSNNVPPADYAEKRPHQLFLTGDQIYADDVADALLELLTDAGTALLGWDEMLPGVNQTSKDLKPGKRSAICKQSAGFTSGIVKPHYAKSHLFSVGEFCSMYLFVWSDVLWPADLPDFTDVYPEEATEYEKDASEIDVPRRPRRYADLKEQFETEVKRVRDFRQDLPAVRRALANIPTYMILDDHEVTDDWFMNREFCNRVLATQLGPRVIQNALLAYAIFQGWGNTPQRFAETGNEGAPGRELLKAASDLNTAALANSSGDVTAALTKIGDRVGLPRNKPDSDEALVRPSGALDWHYKVALKGYPYEVLVLDCRTARAYPARSAPGATGDDVLPPGLLKPSAFDEQIDPATAIDPDGVTIVLSQAPVLGLPWIEEKQGGATGVEVWELDVEPWSLNQPSFQTVLARLLMHRRRVVVLSGDVHYGFAARLSYRARHPFGLSALAAQYEGVLVQLTSSALKKQNSQPLFLVFGERGTLALHSGGFSPLTQLGCVTPPTNDFAGWVNRTSTTKVNFAPNVSAWATKVNRGLLSGTPPILHLTPSPPADTKICIDEDWLYRIEFKEGTLLAPGQTSAPHLEVPLPTDPKELAAKTAELSAFHKDVLKTGRGKQIVGVNNVGEVSFEWPSGDDKKVIQTLWWRVSDTSTPAPMTTYKVSLKPSDPRPGSIKMNCP